MFFIPIFFFMISMAVGIWLLTKLEALKGADRMLSRIGAWIIIVLSFIAVILFIIFGMVYPGGPPCGSMFGPGYMGAKSGMYGPMMMGEEGEYYYMHEHMQEHMGEHMGLEEPPAGMMEGEKEAPPVGKESEEVK